MTGRARLGWMLLLGLGIWFPAAAQTPSAKEVQALQQRVQALEATNQALTERLEALEKRLEAAPAAQSAPGPDAGASVPEAAPSPSPTPGAAGSAEAGKTFRVYWDKGLRMATADEQFKLKVGGRIMFDVAGIRSPSYWEYGGPEIEENSGSEFRRLRLRFSGEVYEDYLYKAEVDFANNDVEIVDAYVGKRNIPYLGTVQVGQFSEPSGLEALTSSSDVTFMERSMATQALIPYRSRGVMFSRTLWDERMTIAAGAFNGGIEQDNHWSGTARVTASPWYADEGRRVLHLGVSASYRNPQSEYGFYARPGSHLADKHLNTGDLPVDDVLLWGAEASLVLGPFSLQGEYLRADATFEPEDRDVTFLDLERNFQLGHRHFDGFYAQASYFLTGEHRVYNRTTGAFDRVIPKNPFTGRDGWGAWELAVRYEELTLNDYDLRSGVVGGAGRAYTAGLNWHMTPNVRLMLNYVRSHVDQYAYDGDIDLIQARFQTDF